MRLGHWLLVGPLFFGCSGSSTHPPPAANDCQVPPCGEQGGGVHPGEIGSGGSGGTTPDGGSGATGDASLASLTGTVRVYEDPEFVSAHAFSGSGTVAVFGSAGPAVSATASFSNGSYSVVVPREVALWAGIQSTTSTEVMPSLQAVNGILPSAADVAFAQTSTLALIFSGLQANPQTMQSNKAQVVIRFTDTTGTPVIGVSIVLPPSGATVAYDNGSLYSDLPAFAATQGRGMALLLNTTAPLWPGGKLTVNYQHGTPAVLGAFDVYVARGAVSFVQVIPPK
jgi:hypothetical protein